MSRPRNPPPKDLKNLAVNRRDGEVRGVDVVEAADVDGEHGGVIRK